MQQIISLFIGITLLIASSVSAQTATGIGGAWPNSFAVDFSAHLAVEGLSSFAMQADVSGTGTVDRAHHAFDLSPNGTIKLGDAQTVPVQVEYLVVDDTFLFRNPGDVWQSFGSASNFVSSFVADTFALQSANQRLASWDLSGNAGWNAVISALSLADPSTFLSIEHVGTDGDLMHYRATVDLYALMQTDAFVNAVAAFAETQGNNLIIYNHADLTKIVRANSAMFLKATGTLDQYIDLNTNWIQRVELKLDLPIDPTQGGYPDPPFRVSADLDLKLSDFNHIEPIIMPDHIPVRPVDTEQHSEQAPADALQAVYFESLSEFGGFARPFAAQAGDHVTITARGIGLDFDAMLTLLSPDGQSLAENDDHETLAFGLGDYDPQIVDYLIPTSGTYSVRVDESSGAHGIYVLTIEIRR